ncbi:MAG: glycosyltransferase family 2 protein, partial [Myxococcota bacterium]
QVVEAFTAQDYPGIYRVTFVTESAVDPAAAVIQRMAQCESHVSHCVAGLAEGCGQKNHNLLAAIRTDRGSDVFAFADADVLVEKNWLKVLIQPLTLGDRYLATGLPCARLNQLSHAQCLEMAYTGYQSKFLVAIKEIWGGTFAIWRKTMEEIGGTEMWSSTLADDISLSQRVRHYNRSAQQHDVLRIFPLPDLPADIPTRADSISGLMNWFVRQILSIRYYRRFVWQTAVCVNVLQTVMIVSAPFLLWFGNTPELRHIGWTLLWFYVFLVCINWLQALLFHSKDLNHWLWFQTCLIGDFIASLCLVRSVFKRGVLWAGIFYDLDRNGKVLSVEHPQKSPLAELPTARS